MDGHVTRVLSWEEARRLADECHQRKGIVVTTNGCFDLLHRGHVEYLAAARQLGDLLLVGLNSDASVKRQGKGPDRPINDQNARAAVMAALRAVDGVCIFNEDLPLHWLEAIRPDIHVKGGDYSLEKLPETECLKQWGGKTVVLPFVAGFSTTGILARVRS